LRRYYFAKKLKTQTVNREKLCKTLLFQKVSRKESNFIAYILLSKNYKAKLQLEKSCSEHFCTKKGSHKIMVKLTPAINFINIIHTNFWYERRSGSLFYLHVTREKLPKQCSYEKCAQKTLLMKLTPGDF